MAKKKTGARVLVTLACSDCRERTYNDPNRIELNKFCPRCRGGRLHREVR